MWRSLAFCNIFDRWWFLPHQQMRLIGARSPWTPFQLSGLKKTTYHWWFQAPDTLRVSFHALTAHINVLKPPSNPTKSAVNEPATERTQAACMCIPVAMWTITQVYVLKRPFKNTKASSISRDVWPSTESPGWGMHYAASKTQHHRMSGAFTKDLHQKLCQWPAARPEVELPGMAKEVERLKNHDTWTPEKSHMSNLSIPPPRFPTHLNDTNSCRPFRIILGRHLGHGRHASVLGKAMGGHRGVDRRSMELSKKIQWNFNIWNVHVPYSI